MTLSLKDVVHTRYGITGSFSVINDVLSKVKQAVSEEVYRSADGSVSLRLILSPPIPPVVPDFSASRTKVTDLNPAVTLGWNVLPPRSWLIRNTYVHIIALQGPPPDGILRTSWYHLPLSGTVTDNAESPATYYLFEADVIMPSGTAAVKAQIAVQVDRTQPPPPSLANIVYFRAAPNDGYINVGQSATLSWQVTNYQADTIVSLKGKEGTGPPVLNIPHLAIQGSQTVTPAYDTSYTLTVSDSRGQVSQTKLVKLYAASPPIGSVFYFKMTNPQSQVTPCFTIAIYAKDKATAKAMAEQQNGGYKAESIDASQFMTACG